MLRSDLLPTLLDLARDVTDKDELFFDESTPFDLIKEWDSLNHVHMIVRMEKDFGVRFDTSRLQQMTKVQDLLDIIAELKGL
ncbi:MAG: acyl carrier protein [Fibrobacterota bacterium]|nr:acyl carrier protein [Fibrobacterota bacterium]QQS06587.1 MAG: acyl carrier protein [Fibrobacterota bacterium]